MDCRLMDGPDSCWSWRPEVSSRFEQPAWVLRLEGADTLRFLHGQSSQAIEAAPPGSALATCLISPTARMRALARVLVDATGAWLLIEAGDPEAVRTALDRVLFPADRVQLGALQPALLVMPVGEPTRASAGPGSWQQLGAFTLMVEDQLLLVLPAGAPAPKPGLWPLPEGLAIAQELAQRPLLSPQQQERWRLQQGWPAVPTELNDNTNPFELGLATRVSLNKGCYVGQETLAKLATYDGVKQQLRRWCWLQTGPIQPPLSRDQPLLGPTGDKAGTITSVLALPQPEGTTLWLGLALVRRSALELAELRAGAAGDAPRLAISEPKAFAGPPKGPGG